MKNSSSRYCTMPNIPWFRDWFERKFGDLCMHHDNDYYEMTTLSEKHESDFFMAKHMALRGYPLLAIAALLFFQLPWVGRRVR